MSTTRRSLRRALAAGAALLLLLAAGAVAAVQLGLRRALDVFVDETRALDTRGLARPVHRPAPRPGTFAELAGPALAAAAGPRAAAGTPGCFHPQGTVSAGCRAELAAWAAPVRALLEASRGSSARMPEGFGAWDDDTRADWGARLLLPRAGPVVALLVTEAVDAGDFAGALETCADLAALTRDLTTAAQDGAHWSDEAWDVAFGFCARAVDAAPAVSKRRLLQELSVVQTGFLSRADQFRAQYLPTLVAGYGPLFTDAQRARLPADARACAARSRSLGSLRDALEARLQAPFYARGLRAWLAAADAPPPSKAEALRRALRVSEPGWLLGATGVAVPSTVLLERLAAKPTLPERTVALLALVARLDLGEAPDAPEVLRLAQEGEARVATPRDAELARFAFRVEPDRP